MNLNKAFILGNVTKDPEVRSLPSGQQVTNFSIATNRFYTSAAGEKKQEVEFHNIVCFGKLADISSRFLTKGSLILIEGRIQTRNWTNQAGAKQYRTEIIAETLQLGPRGGSPAEGGEPRPKSNFSRQPSHEPEQPAKQDEIPVIEENYIPSTSANSEISPEEQKSISLEDNAADEIDVKDIPF